MRWTTGRSVASTIVALTAVLAMAAALEACSRTRVHPAAGAATHARSPLGSVDWSVAAGSAMSCDPQSGEPSDKTQTDVVYRDVTGDGILDALVTGSCPSSTSMWPVVVVIFDGASNPSAPRVLAILGNKDYLRTLHLAVTDEQIVIAGEALSGQAPMCCPDMQLTITYTRTGNHFVETARSTGPLASPLLHGT